MSRVIPVDVVARMQPMPADFNPAFDDRGHYVKWSGALDLASGSMDAELGFSKQGKAGIHTRREHLRKSVWTAMELARLGRRDLLNYCSVTRHRKS